MILRRLLLLCSTLSLITEASAFTPLRDATPEKLLGGAENLQLVTTAKTLKVFRIVDPQQRTTRKKTVTLCGYECHATPGIIDGPEAWQIIAALSDATNFGGELMCIFDPGVVLRFASGTRTLDIVICFSCSETVLYRDGTVVNRPYFGEFSHSKNTFRKDAKRAFTAAAKKAFPKDKAIQGLRE
jgi:hypothetical protein